jgi:hypothetical protein
MDMEKRLLKCVRALTPLTWYSGKELSQIWGLNSQKRSGVIQHLVKRDMLERVGATGNTRYRISNETRWKLAIGGVKPDLKPTGNGVIDAKLRKEAKLPTEVTPLEALITAASAVGATNEKLQRKLDRIRAILEEV